MEYVWKCEADSGFEGSAKIKMPNPSERFELYKSLKLKVNESGEIDVKNADPFEYSKAIYLIAEKYVTECEITHKESGMVFKTIPDLDFYEDSRPIYISIGQFILKGPKLGKI